MKCKLYLCITASHTAVSFICNISEQLKTKQAFQQMPNLSYTHWTKCYFPHPHYAVYHCATYAWHGVNCIIVWLLHVINRLCSTIYGHSNRLIMLHCKWMFTRSWVLKLIAIQHCSVAKPWSAKTVAVLADNNLLSPLRCSAMSVKKETSKFKQYLSVQFTAKYYTMRKFIRHKGIKSTQHTI